MNFYLYSFVLMILFSSCSSNFLSGRRFNLYLVKVEKNQIKKSSPNAAIQIPGKSTEVISASSENQIILIKEKEHPCISIHNKDVNSKPTASIRLNTNIAQLANLTIQDSSKFITNTTIPASNINIKPWDWASIISFIAGVLGVFLYLFYLIDGGVILWLLLLLSSIIFGGIGLARTSKKKRRGRGLAALGLTLGIAQVIFVTLLIIMFFEFIFLI